MIPNCYLIFQLMKTCFFIFQQMKPGFYFEITKQQLSLRRRKIFNLQSILFLQEPIEDEVSVWWKFQISSSMIRFNSFICFTSTSCSVQFIILIFIHKEIGLWAHFFRLILLWVFCVFTIDALTKWWTVTSTLLASTSQSKTFAAFAATLLYHR